MKLNRKKILQLESEQDDSFFDDEDLNESDLAKDKETKKEEEEVKKESCCSCKPSPICVRCSNKTEEFVDSQPFTQFVVFLIMANTVFLALEYY